MTPPIRLHVTLGDPTGIGPEVVVRALADWTGPRPVVHGHAAVLERAATLLDLPLPQMDLQEPPGADPFGEPGRAQIDALEQAVAAAAEGAVDCLVTAPIQKETIAAAGFAFPGHTDWLAHKSGTEAAMMFVSPRLKVTLATTHVPLCQVCQAYTADRLSVVMRLTAETLVRDFGAERPRIAVCGVNPHAGEGGVLGTEEQRLQPAFDGVGRLAADLGVDLTVDGPLPADSLFRLAYEGRYDAVVAAYHDQGLIPVKLVAANEAVNVTLGLPYVRTSPAHGTAHDIAWTGRADARSMVQSLRLAVSLARARRRALTP